MSISYFIRALMIAALFGGGFCAQGVRADQENPLPGYLAAACDFEKISEPVRQSAENAIVAAGAQALPLVLHKLQTGTSAQKQIVLDILGKIGRPEEEPLLLKLWLSPQEDFFVRNSARGALPVLYSRFPPAVLAARIARPSEAMSAAGVGKEDISPENTDVLVLASLYGAYKQALASGKLAPELELVAGARLRSSEDPVMRAASATVLRYAATQQALSDLLSGASSGLVRLKKNGSAAEAQALVEICRAVEQMHPKGEAPAIEALTSCGDPLVETTALGALAAIGYKNAADALGVIVSSGGGTYAKKNAVGEPPLYPVNARVEAVRLLGKYGGMLHLTELTVAAQDPEGDVRFAAVQTLGKLAPQQSGQLLLKIMDRDNDPQVRTAAAIAFSRSGQVGAMMPLLRDAGNRSPKQKEFRLAAIDALGELKAKEGLRILLDGLSDPDADVMAASAGALGNLGDQRAGKELYQRWQAEDAKRKSGQDESGVHAAVAATLEAALIRIYGSFPAQPPL